MSGVLGSRYSVLPSPNSAPGVTPSGVAPTVGHLRLVDARQSEYRLLTTEYHSCDCCRIQVFRINRYADSGGGGDGDVAGHQREEAAVPVVERAVAIQSGDQESQGRTRLWQQRCFYFSL